MQNARQNAFVRLRPPCVELSQVALRFRGRQATVKNVLLSLQNVHQTILQLADDNALDSKLAEYAFFPLSHVFNEAQRLSSRCVELAVRCLHILVIRGWKEKIAPEMGKQLLILLCLLAGGSPAQGGNPSDDLKVVCYQTIDALIEWLSKSAAGNAIIDQNTSSNIVDQVAYLSVEAVTDSTSAQVQMAALEALTQLITAIKHRPLLASILPRTVSGLTKALRLSTKARRTSVVLAANVKVLTLILRNVLSDQVALHAAPQSELAQSLQGNAEEGPVLDASWLKATTSQVQIALMSVSKLCYHDKQEVRDALEKLCTMVLSECSNSLSESMSVMLETLVVLATFEETTSSFAELKWLVTTDSHVVDLLQSSLHNWSLSLPRLMQGNEDRPKQRALAQISVLLKVLALASYSNESLTHFMATALVDSVSAALQVEKLRPQKVVGIVSADGDRVLDLTTQHIKGVSVFEPIVMSHRSQESSMKALQQLLASLGNDHTWRTIGRTLIDRIWGGNSDVQLASTWLAVNLLQSQTHQIEMESLIDETSLTSVSKSLPDLISDLYSSTLPFLLEDYWENEQDWRLTAMAFECTVMQAQQLGESYRPELIDTLYPILSLLRSQHEGLKSHAMTALNLLASACRYSSTQELLTANVDYLVNIIGIKLNSFDMSPAAPQVLIVMIRLCGASLLPYLDDLIDSMFAALDNFHGYPTLVEMLFEVLKVIVEESARQPQLVVADGKTPEHHQTGRQPSTLEDIVSDLVTAKKSKLQDDVDHEERVRSHSHRPWSATNNGSDVEHSPIHETFSASDGDAHKTEEEDASSQSDLQRQLSKPHKLLLSIAQATAPHLASPSPHVRLTLLQLLHRITPLVSQDEDSFLPLVNAVWPSVVDRLFGNLALDGEGEAVYNVCAAAEVVAQLCEGAGDFMSSRIDKMLPNLDKMFRSTYLRMRNRNLSGGTGGRSSGPPGQANMQQRKLEGAVQLQIIEPAIETTTILRSNAMNQPTAAVSAYSTRTMDLQIFNSLLILLTSILNSVRISADMGDIIVSLLSPIMDEPGHEDVREALESWNEDTVWVVRELRREEVESRARAIASEDTRGQNGEETESGRGHDARKYGHRSREVVS